MRENHHIHNHKAQTDTGRVELIYIYNIYIRKYTRLLQQKMNNDNDRKIYAQGMDLRTGPKQPPKLPKTIVSVLCSETSAPIESKSDVKKRP